MCQVISENGSEGGWMNASAFSQKDYSDLSEIGARIRSKSNPDGPKTTIKERQSWRARNQNRPK